ncbi:MAG: S24 family peptidase [Acidobacteria bacterium]|nr:S24 family peptidase [Acidobacteriota bacterium]
MRRIGRIYVVRTEDGLIIKRAGKDAGGSWQLVSDNPDKHTWPTRPWPPDAPMNGEVKWTGRTFL